jgi:hypothetical protein
MKSNFVHFGLLALRMDSPDFRLSGPLKELDLT